VNYPKPETLERNVCSGMTQFIGCDTHRKYSVFRIQGETGPMGPAMRVEHEKGELERFLQSLEPGSPVALEAGLNWMWMVEQIEKANLEPHLTNPLEAKKRMGGVNKLDSKDAAGLLTLLRSGTLPEVWIPRGNQRDLRGLMRSRLVIRRHVSAFKCRIHGVLTQYGLKPLEEEEEEIEYRDWFTVKARQALLKVMEELPSATREGLRQEYLAMWELERHVKIQELAIQARVGSLGWLHLLRSMPGIGLVLGATIWTEMGDVKRFADAERLAAYAGLIPRTHSSGGKTWRGPTPRAANHYLKWAFVEAANVIAARRKTMEKKHPHVVRLYERVKANTKISGKAKVAVARHLAEACWWILTKKQNYREPTSAAVASSTNG
jgi:transposase